MRDFPSPVQSYTQVDEGVAAYRAALAGAADGSVVIASIGELTNMAAVLDSMPELFARKARRLVCSCLQPSNGEMIAFVVGGFQRLLVTEQVRLIVYMDGSYNFGCGDAHGSGWSPWLGSTDGCGGTAQERPLTRPWQSAINDRRSMTDSSAVAGAAARPNR